ncbi:MAG: hypothetical protein ACJAZ3_001280 [Sphingobacteriales bacterium]|jgi:hypothetical protein
MKKISTFILVLICFVQAHSQFVEASKTKSKPAFIDRLYVEGNLGGGFTRIGPTNIVYVLLNPKVGYNFTKKFSAGPTALYIYEQFGDFSFNHFGGGAFTRYFITSTIYAQMEVEQLSIQLFDIQFSEKYRVPVTSTFIGAGLRQQFGNLSTNIVLLYNLTPSTYTPYPNPIIRIGFGFGF